MKKFNLFSLLIKLGLFGFSVDGAEEGGSNGEPENSGTGGSNEDRDHDLDDNNLDGASNDNKDAEKDDLQKRLEQLEQDKDTREQQEAVNRAVDGLKQEYKTFDPDAIKEKLKEIHEKDPELAERLNNPTGWENLHLKYFEPREVDNDDFDTGDKKDEKFDFDESMAAAQKGDQDALLAVYENSVSTKVN